MREVTCLKRAATLVSDFHIAFRAARQRRKSPDIVGGDTRRPAADRGRQRRAVVLSNADVHRSTLVVCPRHGASAMHGACAALLYLQADTLSSSLMRSTLSRPAAVCTAFDEERSTGENIAAPTRLRSGRPERDRRAKRLRSLLGGGVIEEEFGTDLEL